MRYTLAILAFLVPALTAPASLALSQPAVDAVVVAPESPRSITQADAVHILSRLSREDAYYIDRSLSRAGDNAETLLVVLRDAPDDHCAAVAFLIANMPERDLETVTAEFLLENTALAYEAWQNAPWADQVTEDQFHQYILPFASLNERRDDWRADFYEQLREQCWQFDNVLDAVNWLNDNLNDHFEVYFHATRRPKPDQSPYESIEAGYASCTGLSILLADCCRAVGIPARIVGYPLWTEIQGNHNCVEVFDGRWYNVGGTNSDARDDDWVNGRCRNMTDPDRWEHAVYACCFRKTATHFPLVWDLGITYVPALNVTRFYSEAVDARVAMPPSADGQPQLTPGGEVFIYWAGELVARKTVEPGLDQTLVQLAGSSTYRVVFVDLGGSEHETELALE